MRVLQNTNLLKALTRQPVSSTPVWMMRQAGRYLPEYRALRQQVPDFMTFCATSELAAEAALQPLARYRLDAAIVFADILHLPDVMGCQVHFTPQQGPAMQTVRSQADMNQLKTVVVERDLHFVMNTIRLLRQRLADSLPIIGFSGSPWTLACYMIEGKASKQFAAAKAFAYSQPAWFLQLIDRLSTIVADYLIAQVQAGADTVMLFDTWGSLLDYQGYLDVSIASLTKVLARFRADKSCRTIPVTLYLKHGQPWFKVLSELDFDAIAIDWTCDLHQIYQQYPQVAWQGNLDPAVLLTDKQTIVEKTKAMMTPLLGKTGYVCNLGHGIWPEIDPEHVGYFIDTVHQLSASCRSHSGK